MLWLALHLPALSLEAWSATRGAEQAGRPGVLLHEHQVAHADAAALARGVRPGMKRATALALAPDLLQGSADARRDAQALRAVAHVALGFSPSVAWLPPGTAGVAPALVGVRLELQSCLRYFGGLPALLARLQQALAPLGHQVRLASAPTALGAALLAAWRDDLALGPHSQQPQPLQPPQPPQPLQALQTLQTLQTLLDGLPLGLLAAEQAAALAGMGLHRLADLRQLPRDGLARRFGPALLAAIDQARGEAPEVYRWLTLPPCFASRLELMARADTNAQVLAGARLLLVRLLAWAGARQSRIARFTLVMHHEPRHRHDSNSPTETPLLIAPAQPAADIEHLHSLLAERLGRLPLPAPALELSLRCEHLVVAAAPNGELFASPGSQREGLARLVERLQARLGHDQVQRLVAVADHRPEHATRWLAADPARLGQAAPGTDEALAAARLLGPQPLWLLAQAQPLAERAQLPLHEGRPLHLLAGPERLESGWWDACGPAVRDYFIAQAASGALLWIYRHRLAIDEPGSGWFLHGLFA